MREHHNAHLNLWNKIDQWTLKKGTWISVDISEKLDLDDSIDRYGYGYIKHELKLNNNTIYVNWFTLGEYPYVGNNYGKTWHELFNQLRSQPIGNISSNYCESWPSGQCVDGFYRDLHIDFGSCSESGIICFLELGYSFTSSNEDF